MSSWGERRRRVSSAVRQMPGDLCTAPKIISLSPLSLAIDVSDATLGTSDLWLGTRTGAGGTGTLTESFLSAAQGSMDNRSRILTYMFILTLQFFHNSPKLISYKLSSEIKILIEKEE